MYLLGLLGTLPLAGKAQAPALGPAVVVGSYTLPAQSLVTSNALDAQGNVYVTGCFYGTAQFGSISLTSYYGHGFVAKFDGAGTCQWARQVESPVNSFCGDVAVDAAGNATISGEFATAATFGPITLVNPDSQHGTADIFVARIDPNGNWLWAARAGGTGQDASNALALDAAGNVYVTGGFMSATAAFGTTELANVTLGRTSSADLFVAKLSPQGAWLWARGGGGGASDTGRALALDASANVYLTGQTQAAGATFGPLTVAGAARTNENVLAAKLDSAGTWQWAVLGGGQVYDDNGYGIAVDAVGNAYVTGRFTSPTATFGTTTLTNTDSGGGGYGDVFVAQLTSAGQWKWATQAGGPNDDYGSDLVLDGTGRLAVVGSYASSTAQFGATTLTNTAGGRVVPYPNSLFLSYLSLGGTWLGTTSSQAGEGQRLACLAADARGNLSLAGSFQGASFTLGDTTLAGGTGGPTTGFVTLAPTVPVLAAFAPASGAPGQVVTITGTGFAGVTDVLFNEKPAAAFTVQSATRLLATVPAGVVPGPISVRTSRGSTTSPAVFLPLALAAVPAAPADEDALWPNPAAAGEPWQVRRPAGTPTGLAQATVRNVLGQVVFTTQFSGSAARLLVPRLAPGVYQLILATAGQARQHRVVVAE
ncbi:T9SS type A sorting domain-containing protein [Hymenobacter sp. RP-2-7]|uniref:T9SS type A sorting domain-containing protein n=1 Tax=Hymenobacter polaris TaxID=2682546 RepID=A0A7Y0AFA8_9BACT|nr:SBBP repeat-containing protein [Hymenobacter polaris]NML66319.1 T9SS type A sorting domain-containing protein [Hymenobacter polaris]